MSMHQENETVFFRKYLSFCKLTWINSLRHDNDRKMCKKSPWYAINKKGSVYAQRLSKVYFLENRGFCKLTWILNRIKTNAGKRHKNVAILLIWEKWNAPGKSTYCEK